MDIISSMLLGIVQGLTEFLPISSSGHLVLFQNLLGFRDPELLLDISLHIGTLFSVFVFFYRDLKAILRDTAATLRDLVQGKCGVRAIRERPNVAIALWIIVGTIPTVIMGLFFRSAIHVLFGSVRLVGGTLLITGTILLVTRLLPEKYLSRDKLGLLAALAIGIAQGLAIVPGISRSGTTIVCGLLFGLQRELAFRFSFLLSIPAITGAMILELASGTGDDILWLPLAAGFAVAAVVGFLALALLSGMVRKDRLFYFAPYCWAVGLVVLLAV